MNLLHNYVSTVARYFLTNTDDDDNHNSNDEVVKEVITSNFKDHQQQQQDIPRSTVTHLHLHHDFNITNHLNSVRENNAITHIHVCFLFEPLQKSPVALSHRHLNSITQIPAHGCLLERLNISNHHSDEDFGFYTSSDLIEGRPCSTAKTYSNNSLIDCADKRVQFTPVELEFVIIAKLFNPIGQLLHVILSDERHRQWYEQAERSRATKTKREPHLSPFTIDNPFGSVIFADTLSEKLLASSHSHKGDVRVVGFDQFTMCIQPPQDNPKSANNSKQFDPEEFGPILKTGPAFETEESAHNEGIHYIQFFVGFPDTNKDYNCIESSLIPVPRTEVFDTRVYTLGPLGQQELCRFSSKLKFNDDSLENGCGGLFMIGMLYYKIQSESWLFRATNDFSPIPPTKLKVVVKEVKNLISSRCDTNDNVTPETGSLQPENIFEHLVNGLKLFGGDCYCSIKFQEQKYHTEYVHRGEHLVFRENTHCFPLPQTDNVLLKYNSRVRVKVRQTQAIGLANECLGVVLLPPLTEIFGDDKLFYFSREEGKPRLAHDEWYDLRNKDYTTPDNSQQSIEYGKIRISLTLCWE